MPEWADNGDEEERGSLGKQKSRESFSRGSELGLEHTSPL